MTTTEAVAEPRRHSFAFWLGAITVGALVLRIAYVIWYERTHYGPAGDAFYYQYQANAIAKGYWFIEPYQWKCFGIKAQSAAHPPLYSLYLSVFSVFGGTTTLIHRIATTFAGAATVWFVGAAGREMRSERVGLTAASIAAVYPALWVNDGLLMSETVFAFTIALLTWLSYRYIRRPTRATAAWIGFALALTALARAEALMLVVLLVIPLLLFYGRDRTTTRERLLRVGVACLITVITCAPLVVHNFARFHQPVYLSTGLGSVLEVANCSTTYDGKYLGLWSPDCVRRVDNRAAGRPANAVPEIDGKFAGTYCQRFHDGKNKKLGDESDVEKIRRKASTKYIQKHLDRLPVVIAARLGRTFEVYRPAQGILYADFVENRGKVASKAARWTFYLLAALSIAGAVMLRRRKVALLPCGAMLAGAVLTTIVTYGNVRFRIQLDVVLPLLAAIPLLAGLDRWRTRRAMARGGQRTDLPFDEPGDVVPVGEGGPTSAR